MIEAHVKVRAGAWKQAQFDRAVAELEQLDHEIRSTEIAFDELATTQRVIVMELAEQLARCRATVAPQLTAEAKRAIAAISEGLAALQPHVDALLALRSAVAQFDRNVPHPMGYTVYHRELNPAVVQTVHFFTPDYRNGVELKAVRERWAEIAEVVR